MRFEGTRLSGWVKSLLLIGFLTAFSVACASDGTEPAVLLISLDGFRWDYRHSTETPILDQLAAEGVEAEGLIPVFPSKTFPNHYSIVTGLYPENHGIVSNNMYDAQLDASFSLRNREAVEDGRWWEGEPLWVTAAKQGQKSAALFWPGSEAQIGGVRPDYWERFDTTIPSRERVDRVLAWLDLPAKERPAFISLYFSEADGAGHGHGPGSPEQREAVRRLDAELGRLVEGLRARDLLQRVNLIVVSDHGMAEVSPDRVILLDDYLDLSRVRVVDWTPLAGLIPSDDYSDQAYRALKGAHPHLQVFRKEEMPERFHYRKHPRIPPLLALADEGWMILSRRRLAQIEEHNFPRGAHGYDNQLRSMQGIFLAHGPAFRQGLRVEPFLAIHVFPLLAHLLNLEAPRCDGDLEVVRPFLK